MAPPSYSESPAETVERVILYVEAALELSRKGGEWTAADRLAAIHASLVRDGLRPSLERSLF